MNAIDICSNALLDLGAQSINSFDDDSPRAVLCKQFYAQERDKILRIHPWNCAVKRVILSPDATPPVFDYSHLFPLPADWLRTLSVGEYRREIDYRVESDCILANTNVLPLRYIWRNEDVSTWDASLINIVTLAMAARMAYAITQSASMKDALYQQLAMELKQARAVDGQEDPPETFGDFPLYNSRF